MIDKKKLLCSFLFCISMCTLIAFSFHCFPVFLREISTKPQSFCIVIDPGHGGDDPGKVGLHGSKEKEINLAIAQKLRSFLAQNNMQVTITRTTDTSLADPGTSNQKVSDLKNRIRLIDSLSPTLAVSIHQNSYPSENVHGAQTFYYASSPDSKRLAECVQHTLISVLDPENTRKSAANSSYYMLKKSSCPVIIVECGFLSNPTEASLLLTKEYEEKVAWAIHLGILRYLSSEK